MSRKKKGKTPRQVARREAILETIRANLDNNGYDSLSMRKIAAQAGVSPSTLYEIYGSKESLILYAVEGSITNLSAEEEQYRPGLDRFVHRLESVASFFANNPETGEAVARLLFERSGDSPATKIFIDNAIEARTASLHEMLAEKELTKDVDIGFFARALIGITWGTLLLWRKGKIDLSDIRDELVRSSLTLVQPVATRKGKQLILETLNSIPA